jgi:hypothetical protein
MAYQIKRAVLCLKLCVDWNLAPLHFHVCLFTNGDRIGTIETKETLTVNIVSQILV